MIHRLLAAGLFALLPAGQTAAAMGDNYFPANPFDARFCAGLHTQFRSENAARLACTTDTTAIVVEYYDYWPEAIGQSLALATQTGLTPGIVLVCRNDHAHCEIAAKAVESAFARMKAPVDLWDCGLLDASLSDCDKLE
jgi:hypothetical protein